MIAVHITLILTGGTICSRTTAEGVRRSDAGSAVTVLEQHYRFAHPYDRVQFDVRTPTDCLSEDLTPDDWRTLIGEILHTDLAKTDGIIIAHGTDTLDQTAAVLSAALTGIPVPVLLVSAIAPLSDPRTNGHANFAAAVRLIRKKLAPGVWAVYENSDSVMYLHRGFELLPCQHGSLSFYSQTMQPAEQVIEAEPVSAALNTDRLNRSGLEAAVKGCANVLLLYPYNGLRYDCVPTEGISAVVHATYHSETANSQRFTPYGVQELLFRCRQANIPCYLAPCEITPDSYGSSYDLVQEGAVPLAGMTPVFAYAAVWLGCQMGLSGDALTARVRQQRLSLESQAFRCCI